uniref:S100/CaBP-9k-type calcium binding subdomain domain-containing protein n=1 Tax=Eptatretus burgeri TaxID=7764 RepID=A0A8C4R2K9_EPTBU
MPSPLENAVETLIDVFHKYAAKDGAPTMSRSEILTMFQKEMPGYVSVRNFTLMSNMDMNNDGDVDFLEFIIVFSSLTIVCNQCFVEHLKKA